MGGKIKRKRKYTMKRRTFALIFGVLLALLLCSCGDTAENNTQSGSDQEQEQQEEKPALETAEDYLNALREAGCGITEIYTWTEETDSNGLLGRPGQYISKADFMDENVNPENKMDPVEEYGLPGGTVEVFESESDCDARYEYLEGFNDPSLGIMALNQYMYKKGNVILRVSYNLTPTQVEAYETAFNTLF